MRKLLILCLFCLGIGFAISNFQGLATTGEFDSLVIDFKENIASTEIDRQLQVLTGEYHLAPRLNSQFSQSEQTYTVKGDRALLDKLRASSLSQDVEAIEPNYIYRATVAPNDPQYSKQWHLHNIHAEQAWEENRGKGITVAIIDTGVSQVPDLAQTEFVAGYDFVNNKVNADDDNGHGTHVAGTVAQSTNNNYGVAGVAYEAKIMPLKVLSGSGGGTVSDIAEAIRFAADNKADVINMSLGGGGESQVMKDAIEYAYKKGVVIVAAAGNENRDSASYPARYARVISVAAIDAQGEKAEFSNYGAGVDISAPGGGNGSKIWQETIDPSTNLPVIAGFQGTSMAAPHVAGVVALIKSTGVTAPDEVLAVLQQSVRKIDTDPQNYYGAGHLDAAAAVKLAQKGKITFNDFFRWLRDNGYLNLKFWIDGGAIALLPKVAMVLGSYLLAFLIRNYLPFGLPLFSGLIAGSSGLFFLKGFYIFDLPQAPFRVLGSSIPELGNAISGNSILNPLFASVLIPVVLLVACWSLPQGKWFAVGTSLGVAACLFVSAAISPSVWWLGDGGMARGFLIVNGLLCFGLARFAARGDSQTV
ncbi:S8 family peptidase [Chamaesiphon sp. GL140_3_metabinner_50]|uniref:S8 family peptidase n=1 Tax=Chamaesiphon sp. GL140_3_metabinner_50 TaxID=2970812 RepID=UPI0025EBB611|nr:S8 family peptidase [Chamaesiphon sp. GL140_3_metabinner_50]